MNTSEEYLHNPHKQMTTLNNKQGLTGAELLNKVRELGDIGKEDLLRATGWFQGYGEDGEPFGYRDLYDALIAAAKQEFTNKYGDTEVIHQNVSRISILAYRYLVYQYDLDNGLEDKLLAEQQDEFLADVDKAATELVLGLGSVEAGTVITDVVGVMTHLIAYIRSNRWETGSEPTYEKRRENFMNILTWANDTNMVKHVLEIGDKGFTKEEIENYNNFRWDHHTKIANYFRTVTLDYAANTRRQDVQSFAEGLQDMKAFLSMLDENSEWTTKGLLYVMISAIKFEWRSEKDHKDIIKFVQDILYRWVEEGHAIRAEYRK